MRVGILVPSFLSGKGGAEKVAAQVANLISDYGGAAAILCNALPSGSPSYPLKDEIDARQLNLSSDLEICSEVGLYDLVLGFGMSGFFKRIAEISKLLDVPFAIQECTNPSRMISTLYLRQQDGCRSLQDAFWLRQAVFCHAQAVRFTVPSYAASVLQLAQPFAYAFYNSLTPSICDAASLRPAAKRKIVCVGGMKNANKNSMAAVRAFIKFSQIDPRWELNLYGQNRFVKQFARARKESCARIIDHGVEHDINRIYGDADLLLIPSFEEGLPNVVIEAMTFGVPCIGYRDCPGVNHLIIDGENGFLVERGEPDGLVKALARATQECTRQRLAENARIFAERHFQKSDFEQNWIRLLNNVVRRCNCNGKPQIPAGITRKERFGELLATFLTFGAAFSGASEPEAVMRQPQQYRTRPRRRAPDLQMTVMGEVGTAAIALK